MTWKQFSLYPPGCRNKFQPQQVLHAFLPGFRDLASVMASVSQWYVLFEPSALVRFLSDDPAQVMVQAEALAASCGLVFEPGDCSYEWTGAAPVGEDCNDEAPEYGPEVWHALQKYMQACSEISIEVSKLGHERQLLMTRKLIHLCLNALGMTYLEEHAMCTLHAERALELAKKYYRM
jgi:hypothetical protein